MKHLKIITVLLIFTILSFSLCACSSNYTNDNANIKILDENEANDTLNSFLTKIDLYENDPPVDLNSEDIYVEELPDINITYPILLEGKNNINLEIWTTSEKAGNGNDGWLLEVAKQFNKSNVRVNNQSVSVSIRKVDSVVGLDYIVDGQLPDAWNPSSNLLGKMAESKGVQINTVCDRLVGNVAGVLMDKSQEELLINDYGDTSINSIVQAVLDGKTTFSMTNAYTSATAINSLMSILSVMDSDNPLSTEAENKFSDFQQKVPPPAYTTAQMR